MNIKLFITSLLYVGICFSQNIKIPKSYRVLKKTSGNNKEIKTTSFKMDNDELNDTVVIVKSENSDQYKLLIYLTSLDKQFNINYPKELYTGIFPTLLKTKKNVLSFGFYYSQTAYHQNLKLRYNSKHKNIRIIGYDSSNRMSGGHIEKSYNLLTGKYIITKTTYATEGKKIKEEYGTQKFKKTFVNNIDDNLFLKLQEIVAHN